MGCCVGYKIEDEVLMIDENQIENILFIDRLISLDVNLMNSSSSIVVFDAKVSEKSEPYADKDTFIDLSNKTLAE